MRRVFDRAGTRRLSPWRGAGYCLRHQARASASRTDGDFAAHWLACTHRYRRFTPALAGDGARLAAGPGG